MPVTVTGVETASIAARHGFAAGDVVQQMDGHDINDVLDYRFYMTASRLCIKGRSAGGEPFVRTVEKEEYDELGLLFDTYLMDRQQHCRNKCVFCFIDQLPAGLRDSLYFKDDDSRMSFLFGNYITLTNLQERDIRRILDMHISPVNVSVHTMDPALRVEMMGNPHAGEVLRYLPMLAEGNIQINAQLVLCPGINDGDALTHSLEMLCRLAPQIQSIAAVPVGLTRYRDGLPALRLFQPSEAEEVLQSIDRFGDRMLEQFGQRICYASDEFYLAAGRVIPPASFYEDFPQLENGVGLLALLQDEFADALAQEPPQTVRHALSIATGTAAAPFLRRMAEQAERQFGVQVQVIPIHNHFFGESITVAGLVTGRDLQTQLAGRALGSALLLPASMLRREGDLFLDNMSLSALSSALDLPVYAVPNDGYQLLQYVLRPQSQGATTAPNS